MSMNCPEQPHEATMEANGKGGWTRSLGGVRNVLQAAKLEEKDLLPTAQSLGFSASTAGSQLRLLELDKETLAYVKEGKNLVIRGEKDESAVLCTANATYDVKEAEMSNTMLLLPQMTWPNEQEADGPRQIKKIEACGQFSTYLELRPGLPRILKLRQMLSESEFKGRELESDEVKKFTFHEFLHVIQASEEELKAALTEIKACKIGVYWRLLEFDYEFRVLSLILNLVEENSWPVDGIPMKTVLDTLEELEPREILEQCFHWYLELNLGKVDDSAMVLYSLREKEVCSLLGEALLRAAGRFNLQEFLDSWQQSVPEGLRTSLDQLSGLALVDSEARPPVVWRFAHYELSENVGERMEALFHAKDKWTLDEITPYVQKLAVGKQTVTSLLSKHSRASLQSGVKYYSAKYKR